MRKTPLAIVALILLAALVLAGCSTVGLLLGNRLTFTAPELQAQLDRRFPRDYERLGGLVTVSLLNPRLSIPHDAHRLRLDFDLGIGTLGQGSREPAGRFALTSGLRYDPETRGLHLDAPNLEHVEVPALGGVMTAGARQALSRWLVDYARDEPVYRFDDTLLGRLGARRVGRADIDDGVVVVHLGP